MFHHSHRGNHLHPGCGCPRCWMLEVSLPETNSSHLKMDGWKMTIPFGIVYFQVLFLLVSERVTGPGGRRVKLRSFLDTRPRAKTTTMPMTKSLLKTCVASPARPPFFGSSGEAWDFWFRCQPLQKLKYA